MNRLRSRLGVKFKELTDKEFREMESCLADPTLKVLVRSHKRKNWLDYSLLYALPDGPLSVRITEK
jgi:hypothetical protein